MPADLPTLTIARLCRLLENHGTGELSLPQYRVLGLLSAGDERATQLAARLAVTKPTLTALVDSLVERGLRASARRPTATAAPCACRSPPPAATAVDAAGADLREVLDDVVGRCADPDAVLAALDELRQALDARWAERSSPATATAAGIAGMTTTDGRRPAHAPPSSSAARTRRGRAAERRPHPPGAGRARRRLAAPARPVHRPLPRARSSPR